MLVMNGDLEFDVGACIKGSDISLDIGCNDQSYDDTHFSINIMKCKGPDKKGYSAPFPTISLLLLKPTPLLWILKRIILLR